MNADPPFADQCPAASPTTLPSAPTLALPSAAGAAPFQELRTGNLGVRVADSAADIDAVQALRFRVFYQEMGARADPRTAAASRDRDAFDQVADHLLVVDHALGSDPPAVVGTYRLIRREAAARIGRFYSADEYDLATLTAYPGRILELGRSCVDADYRGRAAMQLLWRGIAAYVFHYRIDLMFGCASLAGTDPDVLAPELTYLCTHHLAPLELRPRAVPERYVDMRRMPSEALDRRRVLAQLPPLIKGYLRLGGFVGDGAVIDRQFNTTDVVVVVKTDLVSGKYYRHYERESYHSDNNILPLPLWEGAGGRGPAAPVVGATFETPQGTAHPGSMPPARHPIVRPLARHPTACHLAARHPTVRHPWPP
jgi:L-ornithine Nalpha-acyltransferase